MNITKRLTLNDISSIGKSSSQERSGYEIKFNDGRIIHLTKRRTIVALLVLIHKELGAESDLAAGNETIPEIRNILGDRLPEKIIADSYGDANKPFSELWNEEGFSFIDNTGTGKIGRSQAYHLHIKDHDRLFDVNHKALRKAPSSSDSSTLMKNQSGRCNFCGSKLSTRSTINNSTFAKDHKRVVAYFAQRDQLFRSIVTAV